MSLGALIEKWALSKEGIGGLILFCVCIAFVLGYNFYRVQDVFSKVNSQQKTIQNQGELIMQNRQRIEQNEKKRQDLNRTMRIIACNSDDLANNPTAQNMLKCNDFD